MSPGYAPAEPETFVPVGPTKMVESWASLKTVDMATFNDGPEAQKALAKTLAEAMTTQGFFVLKNHGISEDEIKRMTNIGWTALHKTPDEEKLKLKAPMFEEGSYRGFKLRGHYLGAGGSKDKIEQFNWFRSCEAQTFPSPVHPFMDEMKTFSKKMHTEVLYNVLRLFAIALELDPEFFVNKLQFEKNDQSWLRCMAYYDEFTPEEHAKRGGVWFQGHTDFNLLSLLCSQPMASLQIQDYTDEGIWKYVPYIPGAIIINAGSYMEWFSGGYFKAAIHRVVAPPDDQRNHTRCSLFAFVIPNDEVTIQTIEESPVLQKYDKLEKCQPVNSEQFARARIAVVGQSQQHKEGMKEGEKAYQIVNGIKLPMFG